MYRDPLLEFNEERHEYRYNGVVVPSVTQVLDVVSRFEYCDSLALRDAQERGNAVHLITHLYDEDDLDDDSVDDVYRPYLAAYIKFQEQSGIKVVESEQRVYHPTYQYAGTLDMIGLLGRKRMLIDKKTGGTYPTFGPQTAAYRRAWEVQNDKRIDERAILMLRPDGTYRLIPQSNPDDWGVFLGCLTVRNFLGRSK